MLEDKAGQKTTNIDTGLWQQNLPEFAVWVDQLRI